MSKTNESKNRKAALGLFGLMVVIFIVLSGLSFTSLRDRPDPYNFSFDGQDGVAGKRVFQAYNCMGCHTLVGNGAYFAPDLTKAYADGGAVWLRTFLSSPGAWPTEAQLNVQLNQMYQNGLVDIGTLEDYFVKYPHVEEAIVLLGGTRTVMPNIAIKPEEVSALIAYLAYTAEIDTAGWPPNRMADVSVVEAYQAKYGVVAPQVDQGAQPITETPVAQITGDQLVKDLGCLGCHSTDGSVSIGPTWKGLFGTEITLTDGSQITVDQAYIQESLTDPNAKVKNGFTPGIMPSYADSVTQADIDLIIDFISSLQ